MAAAEENAVCLAATRKLRAAERRISPETQIGAPLQPRKRSRSIGRLKKSMNGDLALKERVVELEEENRSLWRVIQEVVFELPLDKPNALFRG